MTEVTLMPLNSRLMTRLERNSAETRVDLGAAEAPVHVAHGVAAGKAPLLRASAYQRKLRHDKDVDARGRDARAQCMRGDGLCIDQDASRAAMLAAGPQGLPRAGGRRAAVRRW